MESRFCKEFVQKTVLSTALLIGACTLNDTTTNEHEPRPEVSEGVEIYNNATPPTLEQFARCSVQAQQSFIEAPSKERLAAGENDHILTITHVVSDTDTADTIASCYFEQPQYGRMSVEASNPSIDLDNLKAGESLIVRLSEAMSFDIGSSTASEVASTTNLRQPLVEELFVIEENSAHPNQFLVLPKQAPCRSGELYYVTQTGDSFQSIANKFVTIADDVSAYNALLPSSLEGDLMQSPVDAGYILNIPVHGQSFGMPAHSFLCE